MRGVMSRIYKVGILHERAKKNPVLQVETRSKTDFVITPAQTLAILKVLPSLLHFTLVLTCAATALRASEILALRWRDLLWNEGRIRISKRWFSRGTSSISCLVLQAIDNEDFIELQTYAVRWLRPCTRPEEIRTKHD